ncbi:MAG: DUF3574 domain-containing protein [Methylococcales symbiont of Hymedesmia sp. n. MRB-2018]|nr:MAG: DUF3574 domain-containing protein [Methylococcales symbiont of Hymedesmia sp. n. MRB-2018]KAF3983060.1 MAG: DUF3574 domain-containing protein [Methylococcales symbiont of Hymedesmia sp. n. MRB-2018]
MMMKILFLVGIAVLMSGCTTTKESAYNGKYMEYQLFTGDITGKQKIVNEIYRVRLFFGLSLPNGGAVSLYDWEMFQNEQISQAFKGYNIVDSTGFYKGKPERSKIATFIVEKKDLLTLKELAKSYAQEFQQESVMMVVIPVLEWSFIE